MDTRRRVAREAARLLYTGAAEEYKQAKERAARSLGVDAMPSNYEVAVELDLIAEEREGEERRRRLLGMRRAALRLMRALREFDPRLVGSVWRGTARKGSDIDVAVYASRPEAVVRRLEVFGFPVEGVEEVVVFKQGRPRRSHHIVVGLDGYEAEVVGRPPEERGEADRCEVYGDLKRGLSLPELEKLMKQDPLRKFVPRRRYR
ncbi:hypothetical protein DRO42_05375 [Candidatus Bathyarchaeota archaeon]|nr:MAG: hypothetical protein DRO42_05375 [Candidatus Bathyarchaeota archaeon]